MDPWSVPAWSLIREARRRAGLTQRELAARSGVPQSAIARYERARTLPSLVTLHRLVRACGLDLRMRLEPAETSHDNLIDEAVERTVEERILSNNNLAAFVRELQGG